MVRLVKGVGVRPQRRARLAREPRYGAKVVCKAPRQAARGGLQPTIRDRGY